MNTTGTNDRDVDDTPRDTSNSKPELSPQNESQAVLVRTSKLAVVACALAVLGLLLVLGLFRVFARGTPHYVVSSYLLLLHAVSVSAAILGIIGLIRIAVNAGRLTGKGFACCAVVSPVTCLFLFVGLTFLAGPTDVFIGPSCSSNLSGIGKAMLIYANDYEDQLPRAGGPSSQWTGRIADWTANRRLSAYGLAPNGTGGQVSISASLEWHFHKAMFCRATGLWRWIELP